MAAPQGIFKTVAFGGFEKESVLQYIDKQAEEAKAIESQLRVQAGELEEKLKAAQEQVQALTAAGQELTEQLETANELLTEARNRERERNMTITELNMELLRQKELAAEQKRDLDIEREKERQLTERTEALELKARKYDDITAQMGSALAEARKRAEELVQKAGDEAASLRVQAQQHAAALVEEAEQRAAVVCAKAEQKTSEIAAQVGGLKQNVGQMKSDLHSLLTALAQKVAALDSTIDSMARPLYGQPPQQFRRENCPQEEPAAAEQVSEADATAEESVHKSNTDAEQGMDQATHSASPAQQPKEEDSAIPTWGMRPEVHGQQEDRFFR